MRRRARRARVRDMATVASFDDIVVSVWYEKNHQLPHGHARASNGDNCSFAIDDRDAEFRWRSLAGFGSMERKNRKKVKAWLNVRDNRFKVYREWSRLYAEFARQQVAKERSDARKKRDSIAYRIGDAIGKDPDRPYRYYPIVGAEWIGGYSYRLTFSNGVDGVLDMTEDVERYPAAFMEDVLNQPRLFRGAGIDEGGGLYWPDTAFEVSPIYAYERCVYNDGLAFADEWWKQPPYSDYD